jgi:hypothetical protein
MYINRIKWTTKIHDNLIFNSRIDVMYKLIFELMRTYEVENIYRRIAISEKIHRCVYSLYRESLKCKDDCDSRILDIINIFQSSIIIFKGTRLEHIERKGLDILHDDIEILRLCLKNPDNFYTL